MPRLPLALSFLFLVHPVLAEDTLTFPGIESTGHFATLLPCLKDMSAPDWVKPGTRITFYTAYASIPGSDGNLVEDPNGRYICKANGKRYRFTQESLENSGAGGEGYIQHDILAVEGNALASTYQCYSIDSTWGKLTPLGSPIGAVALAANPGDVWVHPAALAQLEDQENENVIIIRGPLELHGQTFRSITIAALGQASWIYTYDLESGVLLRSSTKDGGRPDDVRFENEPTPRPGNTHQTMQVFCGVRQMTSPLLGSKHPDWVGSARSLHYAGEMPQHNPLDASLIGVADIRWEARLGRRGATWCEYEVTGELVIDGAPTPWQVTGMGAGWGPYWIDPQAAARLEAGCLLDEDPITGMSLSVGASNGRTVSLVWASSLVRYEYVYDLSNGVLSSFKMANHINGTHMNVALQSVE